MDEAGLRRTLTTLASAEAPPARFDIEHAMARGLRTRRIRRAAFWGSAVAAAAAAGVAIALVVVPRTAALDNVPAVPGGACASLPTSTPTASPSRTPDPLGTGAALAVPPVPFNPATPCVSFGWLPTGSAVATLANGNYAQAYPQYTVLFASAGAKSLQLYANAADTCTQTTTVVNCGWLGQIGDIALTHSAPAVGGRPAWWAPDCGLLWQYAPSSWALAREPCTGSPSATPPPDVRSLLIRMAASAKFTDGAPMVFPFWLSGIPAGWRGYSTQFVESRGVRDAISLALGPAADPGAAVDITVIPASDSTAVRNNIDVACGGGGAWGPAQHTTMDGAAATVWTLSESGDHSQKLCASDVHGYAVWLSLNGKRPAGFGSVTALARALHLLGTDPAGWTADPVR